MGSAPAGCKRARRAGENPSRAGGISLLQFAPMRVVFLHGFSVRDTESYGGMPRWLAAAGAPLGITTAELRLGEYVSFDDRVTIDDLSRGLERALRDFLGPRASGRGEGLALVTHSTGGVVARHWLASRYGKNLDECPLTHLVNFAPPHHGSALAQLGKSRLARVLARFEGVEPGAGLLDWLELGSAESRALDRDWLPLDPAAHGIFASVMTGQLIDRKLYDALNAYTGEPGSDGVVRCAAANLNYARLALSSDGKNSAVDAAARAAPVPFAVLPGCSHSGERHGILRSVTAENGGGHPACVNLLKALAVRDRAGHAALAEEFAALSRATRSAERVERVRTLSGPRDYPTDRHSQVVVTVHDDRGNDLHDWAFAFTAGPGWSEQELPAGSFEDRQLNARAPALTYFLNHDRLAAGLAAPGLEGKAGFRLLPMTDSPLVRHAPLEMRLELAQWLDWLRPDETLFLGVTLRRLVDRRVLRLAPDLNPRPIDPAPAGEPLAD